MSSLPGEDENNESESDIELSEEESDLEIWGGDDSFIDKNYEPSSSDQMKRNCLNLGHIRPRPKPTTSTPNKRKRTRLVSDCELSQIASPRPSSPDSDLEDYLPQANETLHQLSDPAEDSESEPVRQPESESEDEESEDSEAWVSVGPYDDFPPAPVTYSERTGPKHMPPANSTPVAYF